MRKFSDIARDGEKLKRAMKEISVSGLKELKRINIHQRNKTFISETKKNKKRFDSHEKFVTLNLNTCDEPISDDNKWKPGFRKY